VKWKVGSSSIERNLSPKLILSRLYKIYTNPPFYMTNTHWNKDKVGKTLTSLRRHTLCKKSWKKSCLKKELGERKKELAAWSKVLIFRYKQKRVAMTVSKSTIVTLQRKVSRELELELGQRQSYNRIHRSKKSYNRRKEKRVEFTY